MYDVFKPLDEEVKRMFLKKYEELASGNMKVEAYDDLLMYSFIIILNIKAFERGKSFKEELDNPSEASRIAVETWTSLLNSSGIIVKGEAKGIPECSSIIFPSDDGRHAEMNFREEEEAARKAGFHVMLFDDILWDTEGRIALKGNLNGRAVYRGWMMKPDEYGRFEKKLKDKGIELLVSKEAYRKMHCFQNVYEDIAKDAVKTLYFPDWENVDLGKVRRTMKRFMVKDEVKSLKDMDFPKYIESDWDDDKIFYLLNRFRQMRGKLLTGGCILKEFVDLKKYSGRANEWRLFVLRGQELSLKPNSGQNKVLPSPPFEMFARMLCMKSPFYTVDFAELADGSWRVIETGDGGVSGPAEHENLDAFYNMMRAILS